jgi:transcriptional regulator with GAF, ATPase, and Fis domain
VIRTRQPLVINEDLERRAEQYGSYLLGGEQPKSSVSVPIASGDEVIGAVTSRTSTESTLSVTPRFDC